VLGNNAVSEAVRRDNSAVVGKQLNELNVKMGQSVSKGAELCLDTWNSRACKVYYVTDFSAFGDYIWQYLAINLLKVPMIEHT